jgi:ABC-type polysaccharide/polyol phosphate export permease
MAITILAMGFLYSRLFHLPLQEYFPFLAAGMLIWNLLSTLITDSTNTFIEAESYLKQIRLPYTAFVLRAICRSFIIFTHNIIVLIPVLFFFHVKIDWSILMELPALLIIIGTAFGYGLLLAMLGARYRDIAQIVASLMQVFFFVTPVIWSPTVLSPHGQFLIQFNPFLQFVTLLRAPLLGIMPTAQVWITTVSIMLAGWVLAFALFARARHRIVYWL